MNYYFISIIGKKLDLLTYQSDKRHKKGDIVTLSLRGQEASGVVISKTSKPTFKTLEIADSGFYIDSSRLELASFISNYYFCKLGEALTLLYPNSKTEVEPAPIDIEPKNSLTHEQLKAYSFAKEHSVSLLFGDTGSGKSEVYFHLISDVLKRAKSAIVMMPEISLTPQMEDRLRENFGDMVAIWHSKVSKKRKNSILEGIYSGNIRVVAGARSALFLPLKNLGLIVVDEEHESSFKSQSRPRINAKDVAIYYALKIGARVVLGSATPSVKSYVKFPHFRLKGRHFDSKKTLYFEESEGLTPSIIKAIKNRVDRGEQVLVFNPTRADFKYLFCNSCKSSITCPYCDISMSLHMRLNALKCHYCNFTSKIPTTCPSCTSDEMISLRAGTSNIKSELEQALDGIRIEKFDRDVITSERRLKTVLKSFNAKEIDVLVGTQMLSKGHDYHNVSLAVILGIDYLLNTPDFSSRERAVSLLLQVAGRSGRRFDGEVLVQSFEGEFFKNYIDSYDTFLENEKSCRESLYPPSVRLATVRFEGRSKQRCEDGMNEALGILRNSCVEIVGYGEAGIKKISSKYRYLILLRSKSPKELNRALHMVNHLDCEIDVDPENLS